MAALPILQRDSHYAFLDGLRGIAVLIVVFSHASNAGYHIIPYLNARLTGVIGVWLFFVLSAFLLTGRLHAAALANRFNAGTVSGYAIARVARIFPAYAVTLVLYGFAGWFDWPIVSQHLMLQRGDSIFWSIPVEVQYYLVMPFLVGLYVIAFRRRPIPFVIICAAVVAFFALVVAPPISTPSTSISLAPYLGAFVVGSCAAILLDNYGPRLKIPLWVAVCVLLSIIASAPMLVFGIYERLGLPQTAAPWVRLNMIYAVGWALVIVCAFGHERLRSFFSLVPLRFVGKVSFSLYLLHKAVLGIVAAWAFVPDGLKGATILILSLAAAVLSHWLVEAPGIRAGRWVAERLRQPADRRMPSPT